MNPFDLTGARLRMLSVRAGVAHGALLYRAFP